MPANTPEPQPTEAEINDQLEILCRPDVLRGEKRCDLLRFLIQYKKEGNYKFKPNGVAVCIAFYEDWNKKYRLKKPPGKPEVAGRALVRDLAKALRDYYDELDETAEDRVEIVIPIGEDTGYEPHITYRKAEPKTPIQLPHPASTSDFEYIGNNIDGITYLVRRASHAISIEDTVVRWNASTSFYPKEFMDKLVAAVTQGGASFESITSPVLDDVYMEGLSDLFKACPDRTACHRLHRISPLMNFTILEYSDGKREVLFGYGRQRSDDQLKDTAVFRSENRKLVGEFRRLFSTLRKDFAKPITPTEPGFMKSRRNEPSDVLATYETLTKADIIGALSTCRSTIRVCIVAWPSMESCVSALRQALQNGCSVEIYLWKPTSEFATMRSIAISEGKVPEWVPNQLGSNLRSLKTLRAEFGPPQLNVAWCEGQASVSLFWIDDLIYFSAYWIGNNASAGPHFLVRADSDTGKRLVEQYQRMILNAVPGFDPPLA